MKFHERIFQDTIERIRKEVNEQIDEKVIYNEKMRVMYFTWNDLISIMRLNGGNVMIRQVLRELYKE